MAYSGGSRLHPGKVEEITAVRESLLAMDDMVSSVNAGAGVRARADRKTPSVSGNDGGLDIAVAVQHVMENLLQPGQGRLASNVIGGTNLFLRDQRERSAHGLRSVMEGRFQRDLRVMQPVGIELYLGSSGAATEEVHRPAFAHHVDGQLPGFRTS